MKVFLYEHITATCDGSDPLYAEGAAMRNALRADLNAIADVEVLDGDFDRCAAIADWTILIAPETWGILQDLAERVEQHGGRLLGPSPEAIRLASDKLELAECWRTAAVKTPDTVSPNAQRRGPERSIEESPVQLDTCWAPSLALRANNNVVVKPRDGAGSERMALIRNADEYDVFLQQNPEGMIVQPFIPGTPASIAFVVGPNRIVPLQPTLQRLSEDFHYRGGELPLPSDLTERAVRLGHSALDTAGPGWLGYIGIDMILGDEGDFAIEINPRLTTSYVGMRTVTDANLADAMLRIAEGKPVPEIVWKSGRVRW